MKNLAPHKKPFYLQAHDQLLSDLTLITRWLLYIGAAFFIASLLLTSLFTSSDDIQGIWILILGWIGLVIFQFSWFANPLNLLALLLVNQRPTVALLLSISAFILASQTFFFSEIPTGLSHEKIFIKEFGLGFYFWYLAQALFLIGMFIEVLSRHKKTRTSLVSS